MTKPGPKPRPNRAERPIAFRPHAQVETVLKARAEKAGLSWGEYTEYVVATAFGMSECAPEMSSCGGDRMSQKKPTESVDAFTAAADSAAKADTASRAWGARAESGRKSDAYNFRFNESQRALLDHAHEVTGKPIQRLIEEAVWPVLEDEYGDQVPIKAKD